MFKVGQKVVSLVSGIDVVKGEIFKVLDVCYCPHCGQQKIDVGLRNSNKWQTECSNCASDYAGGNYIKWGSSPDFAPIEEIPESHELAIKQLLEQETVLN